MSKSEIAETLTEEYYKLVVEMFGAKFVTAEIFVVAEWSVVVGFVEVIPGKGIVMTERLYMETGTDFVAKNLVYIGLVIHLFVTDSSSAVL